MSKNVYSHVVLKLKMDTGGNVWAISIVTGKNRPQILSATVYDVKFSLVSI